MKEAFKMFKPEENVFIIGGEEIYKMFFPAAKTLYVSHVKTGGIYEGHAFFPEIDPDDYKSVSRETIKGEKDQFEYDFTIYKKVSR
jgi:dihydrofolate reductase (trimethoprim resistance protein)